MTKIILSFIFIALAIFLLFGFVKPTFDEAETIKQNTSQYDKALSKAQEIQELKRSLLSRYNLFAGTNLNKLEKLLPDHVDNVRLVLDIDGIASTRGIRISSVQVQKDADKETDVQIGSAVGFNSAATAAQPYQTLVLEFSAIATYEEFKLFLQDLEHSLRLVDLVNLEISPAQSVATATTVGNNQDEETVEEPDIYKFDVGVRTYWLK
jgi:Tfp pilus assembly protein PilO